MLAFLAARGEARRDELIELLWGDVPEAKARNAFRQALHRLRSALGKELVPEYRDRVALGTTSESILWVDRDAFLELADAGQVTKAVELYRGDFLDGFEVGESSFDLWADSERTRLRSHAQALFGRAAQEALGVGQANQAMMYVQRLTKLAPYAEDAALLETEVLVTSGRRDEAVETLRRFATRLESDLDLPMPLKVRDALARLERAGEASSAASRSRARPIAGLPFVGRNEELAKLLATFGEVGDERGATILVQGRSGIGKTRLIEEFVARAKSIRSLLVLRGRERAGGAAVPYAGIAEALRGALQASGVSGTSQHLLAEAARILPELRDAFALPPIPTTSDDLGGAHDAGGRLRFFEGVAALTESIAYEQTTCIVVDDLHHASASTIDLLVYLAGRLQSSSVLFVLASRPEGTAAQLSDRFGLGNGDETDPARGVGRDDSAQSYRHLVVGPMPRDDADALVRAALRRNGAVVEVDVDSIVEAGAGNPARILHLTRNALAGEVLSALPVELRDVLWVRFQACSPAQRRVFFAAGLLQRHAPLQLLAAAAHLPETVTFDAAEALEQQGFLLEVGTGYVVAHDFTIDFVVDASGTAGRALLAGWAADALAQHAPRADAELAHLYAMAGRTTEAFHHARLAGFQAIATRSTQEVGRLFGLALTFAPDERRRREIETLLATVAPGQRRLATPEEPSISVDAVDDADERFARATGAQPTAPQMFDGSEATPPEIRDRRRGFALVRQFRVRSWLAAVALLTVVAAVGSQLLEVKRRANGRTLTDSLLVVERGAERGPVAYAITGNVGIGVSGPVARVQVPRLNGPRWIDSLVLPWLNPLPSPDGRLIAVERIRPGGTDIFAISATRRDTFPIAVGGGQHISFGWSPDSRYLLASSTRTLPDGSFDSDLFAYPAVRGLGIVSIDTASNRAVTEAAWSPTGTRVAWVARVGQDRQQDVFVARPDGSDTRNVSADPSEDYHIAWSSDGTLLGFASERSGSANLYAMDVSVWHLWRLTSGPAHDDHLAFSPDGRFTAFESTRGGSSATYVMPTLGGSVTRVASPGRPYALAGWRGQRPAYVDRLRIIGPSSVGAQDSASWTLTAFDTRNNAASVRGARWGSLVVPWVRVVRQFPTPSTADSVGTPVLSVVTLDSGVLRLTAAIPGWRSDTLLVRIGTAAYTVLEDTFVQPVDSTRWFSLGAPLPAVENRSGISGLYPRADFQWESGVLSRSTIDLRENLSITTRLHAHFANRPSAASLMRVALVTPVSLATLDRSAPQFTDLLSVAWDGESQRVTYTVDRESSSEPVSALGTGETHAFKMVVERGGRVAFYADDQLRWRSTLLLPLGAAELKGQLWLGGRATADWGVFKNIKVTLAGSGDRTN